MTLDQISYWKQKNIARILYINRTNITVVAGLSLLKTWKKMIGELKFHSTDPLLHELIESI